MSSLPQIYFGGCFLRYLSTRGIAPELNFDDVLITGLARDGGLYLPMDWPQFSSCVISFFFFFFGFG